jgi:hypothetical protein
VLEVAGFSNFHESTTISEKTLCQLQDRQAQERGARDLQEPAPQTKARIVMECRSNGVMMISTI